MKKQEFKPNFLQRLLLKKEDVHTERLRAFYLKMLESGRVPAKLKVKGVTPERAASDFLEAITYGTDFERSDKQYVIDHRYKEEDMDCRLVLEQGYLSDFEIGYPATRFTIEKDGNVVSKSTIGANLVRGTEIVPIMEYARIMHGDETYAYIMELAAKKLELFPYIPCDASYDMVQERFKRKLMNFLKLDPTARKIIKEYKALNKEKDKYDVKKKAKDIINDANRLRFDNEYAVTPQATNVINMPVRPPKERERVDD